MLGFEQLVNQLQRTGHRRLVVLSGDEAWTLSRDPSARYVTETGCGWRKTPLRPSAACWDMNTCTPFLTRETGLTSRPSPPSAGPCAPEAFWCCWCRRSPSGPTGPTGILCAGATAQSRSPPRTLFTTFAGCLPPIQMPSSGINIVLCAFPLRQIYPHGSPPAVNRSASRLKSSTLF